MIDSARVVAVCDPDKRASYRIANEYHVPNQYTNIPDMLKQQHLDLVDITTPGFMHYEQALLAIESGMNVLIEKPVALSAKRAEELMKKSHKMGVKVCVMQNYRFRDPVLIFRELQRNGKIGKIVSMVTLQHGGSIFTQASWMWNQKVSGGILYENAVHAIDLHTWLMGEHKRIIGVASTYDEDLHLTTSVQALIEHSNKTVGFLDLRWFASSMFFRTDVFASIQDVTIKLQPDGLTLQSGELGPLNELFSDIRRVYKFGKSVILGRFMRDSIRPHLRIISQFTESIEKDSRPPITIQDVLPTMKLLDEIQGKIDRGDLNG